MKYKLLFLLYVSTIVLAYAQKGQIYLGVESITTTKNTSTYGLLGYQKSLFNFQTGIIYGREYIESNKILGVQGDIMFYPNRTNKFNFFFIGSFQYFNNTKQVLASKVRTDFFQGNLGYGFDLKIIKNLFLKSNISLGLILEDRKFNFSSNDPKKKLGYSGIVSFGLRYQL